MRTLLLLGVLAAAVVHAAESGAPSVREKMLAKIKESFPPLPPSPAEPSKPADVPAEPGPPPVVMQPVIVSDSRLIREVTANIERQEQNRRDEKFSPVNGGTIYEAANWKVGTWWTGEGWAFFQLKSNTPSTRQVERSKERIKELQDLFRIRESPKP